MQLDNTWLLVRTAATKDTGKQVTVAKCLYRLSILPFTRRDLVHTKTHADTVTAVPRPPIASNEIGDQLGDNETLPNHKTDMLW